MLLRGFGDVDLSSPIETDHPDNTGLALRLLGLPGLTGGPRWPDLTGKTAGATLLGGASWAGSTLGLNGTGQYADTTSIIPSSQGLYVSCRFRQTAASTYVLGLAGLVGTYHNASQNSWMLRLRGQQLELAGGGSLVGGTTVLNRWTHAAAIWLPGGGTTLFLDGQPVATGNVAMTDPVAAVKIGVDFLTDPRYFTGQIDAVNVQVGIFTANVVARDSEWSRDPGTDLRLRRLSARAYLLPSAAPVTTTWIPAFAPGGGF